MRPLAQGQTYTLYTKMNAELTTTLAGLYRSEYVDMNGNRV